MEKINGFPISEAVRLIEFIERGKESKISLTKLFEMYGKQYGRAKGSVRNYYYQLLKDKGSCEKVDEILKDSDLKAEKIVEFSAAEIHSLVKQVLIGKSHGRSVRSTIREMARGNEKLILRLQNKYRNILKANPDYIEKVLGELKDEHGGSFFEREAKPTVSDFAIKRLQREINTLYNRLGESLRKENKTLKDRLTRLENENIRLKQLANEEILKGKSKSKVFFERQNKRFFS